uniref:Esterase n=1 Tax=Oryza punctata TaxID=4537 RepID=A0A0E0L7A9_ORYPU
MMAWRAAVAAAVVITRVSLVACCCVLLLVVVQLPAVAPLGVGGGNNNISNRRYNAMFSFGDSTVDTGNICANKSAADPLVLTMAQPPYGITYFGGHPTCRCSDGRLVVDFLAQALGLPLLPPSKVSGGDFRRGANMAIAGATALDFDFLESIGLGFSFWNNGAMNLQLQWFRQLLPSICATAPQGGNDYNAMVLFGFIVDQAKKYTPKIVDNIASGVEKLIAMGAVDIVVPGLMPFGCFPLYLSVLQSSNKSDYDEYGCLKPFNELAIHHNSLLQTSLAVVQARHCRSSSSSSPPPAAVRIMYADYYTGVARMMQNPASSGFRSGITACCGAGGGEYNWELDARCGMKGATACADPSSAVCWDGAHTTEAANRIIAGGWLRGPYCHPPILQ